jgi:phage terminase large subunit-like protein
MDVARLHEMEQYIQARKRKGNLSPFVVETYASLTVTDDSGKAIKPASHHQLWLKLICDERIKRLLIIAPPGSAKTTWMSAYLACRAGFYPESNVILASVNASTAEKRSMAIRTAVERPTWQDIFPGVLRAEDMKYEQMEWSLAPNGKSAPGRLHPTIRAYGTGESIVGSRGDLLLGDDILDMENTRTQHAREIVKEWFYTSFLSRNKPLGRIVLIGTEWNAADLYAELRKSGGWVVCHMPLLADGDLYADISYPSDFSGERMEPVKLGEKVLWPEHFSLEEALELQRTTPEHIFQTTYLGNPTSPHGTIFKREWFKDRFQSPPAAVARWLSIDTGMSDTDASAKSAIVVGELMRDYRMSIVDVWSGAVQFPQLIEKTKEYMEKYNGLLRGVIIERKVSGISLIQTMQQSIGSNLIIGFDPRVSKETRYQQASVWCKLGCVLLPIPAVNYPWLYDFESDLFECPNISYLDVMDAFSQLIIYSENLLASSYQARSIS